MERHRELGDDDGQVSKRTRPNDDDDGDAVHGEVRSDSNVEDGIIFRMIFEWLNKKGEYEAADLLALHDVVGRAPGDDGNFRMKTSAKFKLAVASGRWEEALAEISGMGDGDGVQDVMLSLYKQIYIEVVDSGDKGKALDILRRLIHPICEDMDDHDTLKSLSK